MDTVEKDNLIIQKAREYLDNGSSPAVNSATSNTVFAFSGGITADIKLTPTLFVWTGLLAEHQQFSSNHPNIEQKITQGVSLHVEPYLKIPLSGMGDEAVQIATGGGVNFKVSF